MKKFRIKKNNISFFGYYIKFGDLKYNCMKKKYLGRIRQILLNAEFAKEYQTTHTEDTDVNTHSVVKAFLVLLCENKLRD